jgi:hypothetical protein
VSLANGSVPLRPISPEGTNSRLEIISHRITL